MSTKCLSSSSQAQHVKLVLLIYSLRNMNNYPPATPNLHDTTNKRDSESVLACLMRKQGAPEGSRKAPGVGGREKQ